MAMGIEPLRKMTGSKSLRSVATQRKGMDRLSKFSSARLSAAN
jgi:hypothetical protein